MTTRAADHANHCDWHVDQYPHECNCGAVPDAELLRPKWMGPPACGESFKPGWYCSRTVGHEGPCALWPVSHRAAVESAGGVLASRVAPIPADPARQAHVDSFMEAITNTAIGFALSMLTWHFVARWFGIPMPLAENLKITGIFTVVSIARQYALRRAFDGKTVWQAIRARAGRA